MATKTKSFGTKISYSAAGSVYTDLADVRSIKPPDAKAANVDVTHLESANYCKEFLGGWKDPGECECEVYFTKAQFSTVYGLFFSGLTGTDGYYWKITLPLISGEATASTLIFRGHLTAVHLGPADTADDGKIMATMNMKATGQPTFTAGS